MDNVLIAGIGKTGTTALYTAVKRGARAAGIDVACLFEPPSPMQLAALLRNRPDQPVLTKVMVHRLAETRVHYDDFPHRLMLVRDPRDIVVSRLLFRPLTRGAVAEVPPETLERFVAALEEKERDPASWSVRDLEALADDLGIGTGSDEGLVRSLELKRELIEEHDFTVVRYEDLVDGRLDEVSARLGIRLSETSETSETSGGWLAHISRSKAYGAWRQWFLEQDLLYYDDNFGDYLDEFSYPRERTVAPPDSIDPATSSEYIRNRVEARRREVALRHDEPADGSSEDLTDEVIAGLVDMADDGDAVAGRRAATALRARGENERALPLAREAAARGDLRAMRLVAELLRETADPAALEEAQRWERDVAWVLPLYLDIRELRRRVQRLERRASLAGAQPRRGWRRRLAGYVPRLRRSRARGR